MDLNVDRMIPAEHPGLTSLLWNRDAAVPMTRTDALSVHEANWRHLEEGALSGAERALVQALADGLGGEHLLVAGRRQP